MKAVRWYGKRDIRVTDAPDPVTQEPTDAIVRITSTAICGSDLHLYEVLGAFLEEGDILGHEPMGIVEEVGPRAADHLRPGERVVIPFNISCGRCWMCRRQLYAQCETTQDREQDKGAALFGYTTLYGHVDGGQAEYLRVPQAQGQCHVRRWVDELLPYLLDDADPLGTGDLASHLLPLAEAPQAYDIFQRKEDGCTKVILQPERTEPEVYPGGRGATPR